jgi:hypothetical protein
MLSKEYLCFMIIKYNMNDVEIFPWLHNIDYSIHHNAMQKMDSIPNRSTIALELTPGQLEYLNLVIEILENVNVKKKYRKHPDLLKLIDKFESNPHELFNTFTKEGLAHFDLIIKAKKKSLKIIPIDSEELHEEAMDFIYTHPVEEETVHLKRSEFFAEEIIKEIKKHNNKIYVFLGISHIPRILDKLKEKKIKNKIELKYFTEEEKKKINSILRYSRILNKLAMIYQGDPRQKERIKKWIRNISTKMANKISQFQSNFKSSEIIRNRLAFFINNTKNPLFRSNSGKKTKRKRLFTPKRH